ncbi:MAG: hypothetical protein OEZ22_09400 [Spirochaetia bacterium]|nr:hypothetical protein [Spirochaetia bacterium]
MKFKNNSKKYKINFRKTVILIIFVFASLIINCSDEKVNEENTVVVNDITLSGSVSNGLALANKRVTIKSADGQLIGEAVTDASGNYSIDIPENTPRPLIVTATVDENTNLNNTILKGSLDFSSYLAGLIYKSTSNLTSLTVNINPMTDHINEKVLGSELANISSVSDDDFNTQANSIIKDTIGSNVIYSSFSDDASFQAPISTEITPSASGLVLDTLVRRANNETTAFSTLLDNHGTLPNCNGQFPPPFLNEDKFQVSLASNYLEKGFTTAETSASISALTGGDADVLAALDELTVIINDFITYATSQNLSVENLKTALDALTNTVLTIIDDAICDAGGTTNSLDDINADALGNLTTNTVSLVDNAIITTVSTTTLTGESEDELLNLISTQIAAILDNEDLTTEVITDTTTLENTIDSTADAITTTVEETGDTTLTTMTDAQAVSIDATATVITFSGNDTATSITQNIILPVSGFNGSIIAWQAYETGVPTTIIASDGTITQPYGNVDITLTATIAKGTASETKDFTVTVIGAFCGDGIIQAAYEACDDGDLDNTDICLDTCELATCGDGFVQAGVEDCDSSGTDTASCVGATCLTSTCGDGYTNTAASEQCDSSGTDTASCVGATCLTSTCGDGYTNTAASEQCDSSGTDTASCVGATCLTSTCGDGYTNAAASEQCDSNGTDTASCVGATCNISTCGDGYTNTAASEQCDSNGIDTASCVGATCLTSTCGDGYTNTAASEQCDSSGTDTVSCVGATCLTSTCGDGYTNAAASEQCDSNGTDTASCVGATCNTSTCGDGYTNTTAGEDCDTSGIDTSTCNAGTCLTHSCGDGYTNTTAGEDCDDANAIETDACLSTCVTASCGDGFIQTGVETCDDANADDTDSCPTTCQTATCGDGFVQAGVETCDDANAIDTDACLSTCTAASCGDGFIQAGVEDCDDANAVDTDACLSTCTAASCGDGFIHAGIEACDDANALDTDACLSTCELAACGDGFIQAGVEDCDDANADNTDACLNTCTAASCGDGFVQAGIEDCDDANAIDTDACLSTCVTASCGDGFIHTGIEACDDGDLDNTDICLNTCELAACGDGFVQTGVEECDDANAVETDACLSTCVAASCGDGFVQAGVETCDDANADNTDSCPITCQIASCGDGFVQAGVEECDDANAVDTDACLSTCVAASCGDGFVQSGVEECDDANAVDTDACLSTCVAASCGDGFVHAGVEDCDDSNTITESCLYGETSCTVCDATCFSVAGTVTGYCGDGITDGTNGETCDDGNSITDVCTPGLASCTICDATCNEAAGGVVTPAIGTISASESIILNFPESMATATLVLSGALAAESNGGIWSNANSTLTISPAVSWSSGTGRTITIAVSNLSGNLTSTTLSYDIDGTSPTVTITPSDTTIISTQTIVITFSETINTTSMILSGILAGESDGGVWSDGTYIDNTLTISPTADWSEGSGKTLNIYVEDNFGNNLDLNLTFAVLNGIVYVKTTGSDANSGTSDSPKATIQEAINTANANFILEVHAAQGTYNSLETIVLPANTALRGGYSSADWAVQDSTLYPTNIEDGRTNGGATSNSPVATIDMGSNSTLDSLIVIGQLGGTGWTTGILISDNTANLVNNEVSGADFCVLLLNNSSSVDTHTLSCTYGVGVLVTDSANSHNPSITNNVINASTGVYSSVNTGASSEVVTTVEGNDIFATQRGVYAYSNGTGGPTKSKVTMGYNYINVTFSGNSITGVKTSSSIVKAYNNIIVVQGNTAYGFDLSGNSASASYGGDATGNTHDVILSNTLNVTGTVGGQTTGIMISTGHPLIEHNIIMAQDTGNPLFATGIQEVGSNADPNTVRWNDIYSTVIYRDLDLGCTSNFDGDMNSNTCNLADMHSLFDWSTTAQGNVATNPVLDASYTPQSTSPCIVTNGGTSTQAIVNSYPFADDINAVLRTLNWSIGAIEYDGSCL